MADVFVSYARSDKARVAPLVAAIERQGWSVWWDPEIDAGQHFDDQIEAELKAAMARRCGKTASPGHPCR
jgi:adenylate cyclase